jgi:hypothetical protein
LPPVLICVPSAKPPEDTVSVPPLDTIVPDVLPPEDRMKVTPPPTLRPLTVVPEATAATAPLLRIALDITPPAKRSWPPDLTVVPPAVPPESTT